MKVKITGNSKEDVKLNQLRKEEHSAFLSHILSAQRYLEDIKKMSYQKSIIENLRNATNAISAAKFHCLSARHRYRWPVVESANSTLAAGKSHASVRRRQKRKSKN